jgi:Tfp pilus assembly protein PilO
MIRTIRAGRLWLLAGALAAVAMVAAAWFGAIGPQYAQASSQRADAAAQDQRAGALRSRIDELRRENANLTVRRAELADARAALPTDSGIPDLLRELQKLGDRTGVSISGLTVGVASETTAGTVKAYSLPLTMTATGTTATLHLFVDQLQHVQPRAVLINSANVVLSDPTGTSAGPAVLTVTCQVFVAPPAMKSGASAAPVAGTPTAPVAGTPAAPSAAPSAAAAG